MLLNFFDLLPKKILVISYSEKLEIKLGFRVLNHPWLNR